MPTWQLHVIHHHHHDKQHICMMNISPRGFLALITLINIFSKLWEKMVKVEIKFGKSTQLKILLIFSELTPVSRQHFLK